MTDSIEMIAAQDYLAIIDQQEYEIAWNNSSEIIQSAVALDDFRKSLRAARAPLGSLTSRALDTKESPFTPIGAPDGNYTKLMFNSVFEKKSSAQETLTLVEESDGQWRAAGYYIK